MQIFSRLILRNKNISTPALNTSHQTARRQAKRLHMRMDNICVHYGIKKELTELNVSLLCAMCCLLDRIAIFWECQTKGSDNSWNYRYTEARTPQLERQLGWQVEVIMIDADLHEQSLNKTKGFHFLIFPFQKKEIEHKSASEKLSDFRFNFGAFESSQSKPAWHQIFAEFIIH